MWDRLQKQEDGEGEKVDDLMHENDNLNRDLEKLTLKVRML